MTEKQKQSDTTHVASIWAMKYFLIVKNDTEKTSEESDKNEVQRFLH